MYDEAIDYDENLDDESFDDESFDDEMAEFLPGPLGSLVSGLVNPLAGIFGSKPAPAPLPGVRLPTLGPGVTSAQLNTPAGSATLALPSALVRQDEFRVAIAPLKEGIDRNTSRLNTVTADVTKLRNDFVKVETDTRNQVAKLRTDTRKALIKARKEQAIATAKWKKDQSSQQMMNLMMTMMMQQRIQEQLDDHTHLIPEHKHGVPEAGADKLSTVAVPTLTANASTSGDDSNDALLMMLPLMMMQDGGSGNDNMMMPMMMMMALK